MAIVEGRDHLRDQQFVRMAFYGWGERGFLGDRSKRFLDRCQAAGVHADRLTIDTSDAVPDDAARARELATWLASLQKPVGIMTTKDSLAFQVVETCRHLGLRVPDDVAVVGSDNDEILCEQSHPTISAVNPGFGRICLLAAAAVDRLLDGDSDVPAVTLFTPVGVVTRDSTDVTAADDPDVRDAIRHIREEAARGLTAEEVVARVPASRRTFERRFREAVGCSPLKAIHRRRIDLARQLLVDTNLSVDIISRRVGYETLQNFRKAFSREAGTTPRRFRLAAAEPEGEADDSSRTPPRR